MPPLPMTSPQPWSLQERSDDTGGQRTEIVDGDGEGVMAVRKPTPRALANAHRIIAATTAVGDLSDAQLSADVPRRAIVALKTLMKKFDTTSSAIPVSGKMLAQLQKLLKDLE